MKNSKQKLFEIIEEMKKGKRVDSSDPLFSVAQKIIQSRPLERAINQEHKNNLKLRLEEKLKTEEAPKVSVVSILRRIFSFQPQNLVAYGSLITIICLAMFFTGFSAENGEIFMTPQVPQTEVFRGVTPQEEVMVESGQEGIVFKIIFLAGVGFGVLVFAIGLMGLVREKKRKM